MNDFIINTGFKEIQFTNIGKEKCKKNHSFGPISQDKYMIHIIFSGSGSVEINNSIYNLSKGNYFFFQPDDITYYYADSGDPWTYFWFGFVVEENFNYIVKSIDTFGSVDNLLAFEILSQELLTLNFNNPNMSIEIQSKMLNLLDLFLHESTTQGIYPTNEKTHDKKYADYFCKEVKDYYWRTNLEISEISHKLGLNNAYFSTIIKKQLGETPLNYLINYRLIQSWKYVVYTDLPISEVALKVGYQNSNNFSRNFKNKYGKSPSDYRKSEFSLQELERGR